MQQHMQQQIQQGVPAHMVDGRLGAPGVLGAQQPMQQLMQPQQMQQHMQQQSMQQQSMQQPLQQQVMHQQLVHQAMQHYIQSPSELSPLTPLAIAAEQQLAKLAAEQQETERQLAQRQAAEQQQARASSQGAADGPVVGPAGPADGPVSGPANHPVGPVFGPANRPVGPVVGPAAVAPFTGQAHHPPTVMMPPTSFADTSSTEEPAPKRSRNVKQLTIQSAGWQLSQYNEHYRGAVEIQVPQCMPCTATTPG